MADPAYPYDLLAKHKICPATPARDFLRSDVPVRGEANRAWRLLRDLPSRLVTDFYLYRTADADRLTTFHDAVAQQAGPANEQQIQVLDEAAALVLLIAGKRSQAQNAWELIQQQAPGETRISHYLALFYYAEAQYLEEHLDYPAADAAWLLATADWIRTLTDETYWENWCDERQSFYGMLPEHTVTSEQRSEVRQELRRKLEEEFVYQAEQHAREGRSERADRHRQFAALLEAEWLGALAMKEAGGLSTPDHFKVAGGLQWILHMGLEARLTDMIAAMQQRIERIPSLDMPELLNRLRWYFSQLGSSAALLQIGKARESLEALRECRADGFNPARSPSYAESMTSPATFLADAALLAIEAHIALSRDRITASPPDLAAAQQEWQDALNCGREGGLLERAAAGISDLVLDRVNGLRDQTNIQHEAALSQAIEILDAARDCVRESPSAELDAALGECLNLRGWQHFLDDRFKEADADLYRAYQLFRDNTEFLNNWCQNMVGWAKDCGEKLQNAKAAELLARARSALQAGLRNYPGDPKLLNTAAEVDSELGVLSGTVPETDAWIVLAQKLEAGTNDPLYDDPRKKAAICTISGEERRRRRDFAGAEQDLREAMRLDEQNQAARLELAQVYHDWATDLFGRGLLAESQSIIERAAATGVDHPGLVSLARQIQVFEELFGGSGEED